MLADEINRTTPRTQSSLLEAMSEGRVSIDNHTHELEQPFIVIATQNPLEHFGTYPLPESQMDRFLLRIRIGYPSRGRRARAWSPKRSGDDPVEASSTPASSISADVAAIQASCARVRVDEALLDYAQRVVAETRALAVPRARRLAARLSGLVSAPPRRARSPPAATSPSPTTSRRPRSPALAHRLVLAGGSAGEPLGRARDEAERVLADLLERVPVPA